MANKYRCNDIMRLIGKQHIGTIVDDDLYEEIMSIVEANIAHRSTFIMMCMDIFVYGYIKGKHAERERKHKARKIG